MLPSYQVPWYFVDGRCGVQLIDHATLGGKLGCPPPPLVSPNERPRQAAAVTVPAGAGLPRVVSSFERERAEAAAREAQWLASLPPADRVAHGKEKAARRRRFGDRRHHVSLNAHADLGRTRLDHRRCENKHVSAPHPL